MTEPDLSSITDLLARAGAGDRAAAEDVARAVQGELRVLAAHYLARERSDHTLQPTALVNEAYLKLLGQERVTWKNRAHFFGIAANIMRRILVDHARRSHAARRDRANAITLDESLGVEARSVDDILGVHEALDRLSVLDPRQARIVELKFFAGLSLEEIAEVVEISPATVSREWAMARVWLEHALSPE